MKKNLAMMTKEELLVEHYRVLAENLLEVDPGDYFGADAFTMLELKERMEAVAGVEFDRDTFRRRMLALEQLKEVGMAKSTGGRPARTYVKVVK
jgi:hypothetical protein